jgi:hypothetical protein
MERETPDYRSNVIYVYDSDPEAERCPYTIAVVMPRRINLQSLLGRLNLQTDCPPHVLENLCSLWFGRIPIGTHHEVNVLMGNAFRLIIGGGIRLDVPHLLLLENSQIRSILQRAIRSEIFDRPTEPSFVNVFATPADSPCASGYVEMTADNRPSWIPVVEQHFRRGHQREPPAYHPTLTVQVWYLNNEFAYHCADAREASITDESFMWRTDFVFRWRNRITRASPVKLWLYPILLRSHRRPCPLHMSSLYKGCLRTPLLC